MSNHKYEIEKLEKVIFNLKPAYKFEIREVTRNAKILCFTTYAKNKSEAWEEFQRCK